MSKSARLKDVLESMQFPRSNEYDPQWIITNQMGLNPLWLTEWLCEKMPLTSGMRVLDLGCGKALSSIFLAKEYGVQVWAADLWIKPTDNYEHIRQAGVEDCVFPITLMRAVCRLQKDTSTQYSARTPISTLGQMISTWIICINLSSPAVRSALPCLGLCAN